MLAYYARILKALTLSKRGKKIRLGEVSSISWICLPSECDDLRIMNASRILNLAELGSHYNNMRNGFFTVAVKRGLFALTRRYHVDYHKPVKVFRRVTVKTRLCFWNEQATVWHHQVYQSGALCSEVYSDVRVRNRQGRMSPFEAQRLMDVHVPSPKAPEIVTQVFGYQ